jgi:hypothetical protein
MRKYALVAALAVSFSAVAADAPAKDAKAAAPAAPAAPAMTPEGKKLLEGMIGKWTMKDAAFKMGDKEMKCKMVLDCAKSAAGWGTTCKGSQDCGKDMPKIEGLYTFAWDIVAGEGHMLEVESMGNVHNHVGKWTDEKTIALTHTGKNMEGKDEADTVTFTWNSPKEMAFKAEGKSGETVNWSVNGVAKK